jgi:hypothetical protein
MTLTIYGVRTGDDAADIVLRIEEFQVTVLCYSHSPTSKEMTLELEGPEANYLLRNKLNKAGIRPDWVTNSLR